VRTINSRITRILSIALVALATVWTLIPGHGSAVAEEDARSAKFIMQSCQNFLSGDPSMLPFLQGRCFGVIDGLAFASPEVCPPATTTGEEMVRTVVNYISARPDRMREDFRVLALDALQRNWPCN